MSDILIQQNNEALVPPEFPTNVREQAPVLIQENILQDGGIAATVEVASTSTLDPDTPAYVNNIGDEKHAVLQFGIPKGETGAAGSDGVDGQAATITVGSTTTVDPDEAAAVVNSGTSQNAILDFSIPQGVQGEQGEQGVSPRAYVEQTATGAMIHIDDFMTETNVEVFNGQDGADGQAATITVGSTTTGAAGTNASVVNSGSSSAAVLDFTIPRGADGAAGRDGTDGTDGSDGFSPIATVSQTASGATISITDAQGTTTANITNGVDGTDGTDGSDGFSPIATVSQTASGATISITDAQGTTTANITNGTDGQTGQAATITVGSTTTGAAGTNASVVNSGTSSAAVLDFVIPRGADGTSPAKSSTTITCSNASVVFTTGKNTITVEKYGKICIASFSLSFTADHAFNNYGNLDIANFPAGYRPESTTPWQTILVRNASNNVLTNMVCRISDAGVFRLQNGTSGSAVCSIFDGSIVYMTA